MHQYLRLQLHIRYTCKNYPICFFLMATVCLMVYRLQYMYKWTRVSQRNTKREWLWGSHIRRWRSGGLPGWRRVSQRCRVVTSSNEGHIHKRCSVPESPAGAVHRRSYHPQTASALLRAKCIQLLGNCQTEYAASSSWHAQLHEKQAKNHKAMLRLQLRLLCLIELAITSYRVLWSSLE